MSQSVFYFAYGANMSHDVFQRRRRLHPLYFETATLNGWQMVFEQPGIRFVEPVFATLKKRADHQVKGVLYKLSAPDIDRLNRTEGAGYELIDLLVTGDKSGSVSAFTYVSRTSCSGRKPSRTYLNKLIQGATEHGLPSGYIDRLRQVETVHIPIISFIMDKIGWLAIRYTGSGRSLNNKLLKFGASIRPND